MLMQMLCQMVFFTKLISEIFDFLNELLNDIFVLLNFLILEFIFFLALENIVVHVIDFVF